MIILLSLVPLLAFLTAITMMKRESGWIQRLALLGSITPLLFLPILLGQSGTIQNLDWFSVGASHFQIATSLLPINLLLFALVALMGPLVVLYSWGFMNLVTENKRFYLELLSFQAAMLAFALSGNFILLFVAWEFLSVTSYLLIGFWNHKEAANIAAREAITIILIGDIALLAGIAILYSAYSTLQFGMIVSDVAANGAGGALFAALTLLVLAAFTKSAQFPFQEWLSAAMEGPTPVSAFLHSSTMVKAGVFMIMILYPLFVGTRLMEIMVAVGAATALIAIMNALAGSHIKKILAYSTIEELGLMFFALGIGAYSAAIYFFFAQTFYKALLFFYSGNLIRANDTEQIGEMHEAKGNKILLVSAVFGALALAGFVPFNGFVANITLENAAVNTYAYAFLLGIDLLVSIFIMRWLLLPLKKFDSKSRASALSIRYRTLPRSMIIPGAILAALALVTSAMLPYISNLAKGMAKYGYAAAPLGFGYIDIAVETALAAAGIAIAYVLFYKNGNVPSQSNSFWGRVMNNGLAFDGLYHYVANFGYYVAGAFEFFDEELNALFDWVGGAMTALGDTLRYMETGLVNSYVLAMLAGLAIVIIAVIVA